MGTNDGCKGIEGMVLQVQGQALVVDCVAFCSITTKNGGMFVSWGGMPFNLGQGACTDCSKCDDSVENNAR